MLKKLADKIKQKTDKLTYRQMLIAAGATSILLGVLVFVATGNNDKKPVKSSTQVTKQVNTVTVVMAKQDIPNRTIIRRSMLKQVEMPTDLVPNGAYNDMSDCIGKPASTKISQGDVVTSSKVLSNIQAAGFTGMIPDDCRAVTIRINDITGVAGFAQPGDYVDIVLMTGGKEAGRVYSKVIFQDVLLLGINHTSELNRSANKQAAEAAQQKAEREDQKSSEEANKTNGDQKKNDAKQQAAKKTNSLTSLGNTDNVGTPATATVALKPQDALKLITDAQDGQIYLMLRPYNPSDPFTTKIDYIHLFDRTLQPKNKITAPGMNPPRRTNNIQSANASGNNNNYNGNSAANSSDSNDSSNQWYDQSSEQMDSNMYTVEVIRGNAVSREGVLR